ncbi:sugar phosphate permease [Novosphingobium sp. PhB165]|uniref:MFS transporter n=1 Tax=Novosphingobium sp. PhB165 TaxID=2485105 RepID=UPI0010E1168D|nr:MFS transporter [Novosphingobium sp. PhB165]TCM20472.1 sugar phosphate permease [Novosphingobium sp. PhB165]
MTYLGELRSNARTLFAASLGTGAGLMLMSYTTTIFGPYLVKEFAWSRAQFALIGLSMLTTLIALPFVGRFADRFGVRRVALVGAFGIPACLVAYSLMNGVFLVYFAISCSILMLGSFTSPVVYTRLIAANFTRARGLALTIVTIAPAILGAAAAPLLTTAIDAWGWRVGYRLLAAGVFACSLLAIALIPAEQGAGMTPTSVHVQTPAPRGDYRLILSSSTFWVIFAAMFLCTLQTPLHSSQMGMMLHDNHLGSGSVAAMISVYGLGTVVGRIACGLALDRFPAPYVAAVSMIVPSIGYALLASPLDQTVVIGMSMAMIGIAVGAEGDLQSFLVARHFGLRIFSSTLSCVYVGVFAASALGALALSISLRLSNTFAPFLGLMAVAVFAGSLLFLLLPNKGPALRIGDEGDLPDGLPAKLAAEAG